MKRRRDKRPSVGTAKVADQFRTEGERIVEFTFPSGKGGLISFRDNVITIYRQDPGVFVQCGDFTLTTTEEEKGPGWHRVVRLPPADVRPIAGPRAARHPGSAQRREEGQ